MAPAASCGALSLDTPGSCALAPTVILGSRSASSLTSACLSTRFTYGPSLDAAAPAILASCRNVLEEATR